MPNARHNKAKDNKAGIAKSFLATHHAPKTMFLCKKCSYVYFTPGVKYT